MTARLVAHKLCREWEFLLVLLLPAKPRKAVFLQLASYRNVPSIEQVAMEPAEKRFEFRG